MSEALLISSSGGAALTTAASTCDAIAFFNGSYETSLSLPISVSKIVIGSFMNSGNDMFVPTPIACGIGTFHFNMIAIQLSGSSSYVSTTIYIALTDSKLSLGMYNIYQTVSAFIFCYK